MSDDDYDGAESLQIGYGGGGIGFRDSDSDEDAHLLSQMIESQATESQGGVYESQPDMDIAYALLDERQAQHALDAAASLIDPTVAANAAFWATRADVVPSRHAPSLSNATYVNSSALKPPTESLLLVRDPAGRALCERHGAVRHVLRRRPVAVDHAAEQYGASVSGCGQSTVPVGVEWRTDAATGQRVGFRAAPRSHQRRLLDTLAATLVSTGDLGGAAQCVAARLAVHLSPDPPPHVLELWLRLLEMVGLQKHVPKA
jgi:hypothetical protein